MVGITSASMDTVDVAVIGRGMIGSAAARHLVEAGHTVALIGPPEPDDRTAWTGPFCSHPDEGRITRIAARTDVWAEIAARSISRYADLETRSGIALHTPCGLVSVFDTADEWVERGNRHGSDARRVDVDWVRATTGIAVTNGLPAMYEGAPAGYINPRRMVAAQTEICATLGATVINHAVESLDQVPTGFRATGPWGSQSASRVLLATGAFGSNLWPGELAVERRPRTIVMAELEGAGDAPSIPSLILDAPPDERLHEIYWVPPVRFPDGVRRLKIGGNLKDVELIDVDGLTDWFHGEGSGIEAEALTESLRALLPDSVVVRPISAPCVITSTGSGHPYIGWVDDNIAVAIGGNGAAAKSSDELGRLASTLFADDGWTDSISADAFTPRLS